MRKFLWFLFAAATVGFVVFLVRRFRGHEDVPMFETDIGPAAAAA